LTSAAGAAILRLVKRRMLMAHSAVGEKHMKNTVLECPRDGSLMHENVTGEAILDVCGKCGGQFFDTGEMFGAFGIKADPSAWDREGTAGAVREGSFKCPRCNAPMLAQDIAKDGDKVEIDRCPKCRGIWLDKGEVEQIMAIGAKNAAEIAAEKAKAQEELDKMGEVDFSPGLIARFLAMFKKK
jgi:Zn-finger nucleic acid-binding protein